MTRALPNQSVAKGVEYARVPKGDAVSADAKQWQGWGTALKPALEPVVFARKPVEDTIAANVLKYGTGAINIDGCRIGCDGGTTKSTTKSTTTSVGGYLNAKAGIPIDAGRWPANVTHDGSDEVLTAFPDTGVSSGGRIGNAGGGTVLNIPVGQFKKGNPGFGDAGSAARFFFSAKADANDRLMSKHPTVKPVALMRWLIRLVTPPGGLVLDPFAGSGTTGVAAIAEAVRATLMEREPGYVADIRERIAHAEGTAAHTVSLKARRKRPEDNHGPLFGGSEATGGGDKSMAPLPTRKEAAE